MIYDGIKSLTTIVKNEINGVEQEVSEEVKSSRLLKCADCPSRIKITNQCSECGCFLNLKTKYKQEECPIGKWLKEE